MSAVSQSYPNYLGGLNEQPDELKKPGQLVEALNVIPDPVIGLTRRPGFQLIPWTNNIGNPYNMSIDSRGTWFEMELTNQVNDDYIYFGCVGREGEVTIFNQDGERLVTKYTSTSIIPHKNYLYNDNKLIVTDDDGNKVQDDVVVQSRTQNGVFENEYFQHDRGQPLKYCVSKDHIIFTNPTKIPTLAKGKQVSNEDEKRYYSFINLKVVDVDNYNYTFKRWYPDKPEQEFSYIKDIDIDEIAGLQEDEWNKDLTLPLLSLDRDDRIININGDGVDEQAVVEIKFAGQVVQRKSDDGDGYYNRAVYTYSVDLISAGKGFSKGTYTETFTPDPQKPPLTITFNVAGIQKVTGTQFDAIIPEGLDNQNDATSILNELASQFRDAGIDKTVVVGNGLYLENNAPFSVSTDEIAVADVINSQKNDGDPVPFAQVNTTAELPLECYPGFIVQVRNSFDGQNDYFLQYKSESEVESPSAEVTLTKADGFWEEIARPYEAYNPNNATMPHMITVAREEDRTEFVFIISPLEYKPRTAGDISDNPSMFADNTPITSVNYYKNRLFFFTNNGTVLSSQAGNIDNIFINTALSTSIIDPLDLVANSNQRVPIHSSIVVNNSMVLFGDTEQYSVTTDGSSVFSTETVNITKISNYTFDRLSDPTYLGTNIGFISGGLSRFYEMTNVYDRGPVDVNERSQQIQTQFGQGFNMPASSREQSMMLVYKKYMTSSDNSNAMYLYRFRQENSQESSQTSWVRWEVDAPVAYVSLPQDKAFVVVGHRDQVKLYKMDSSTVEGLPASSASVVPKFTDGWTAEADGVPFTTRIKFPTIFAQSKSNTPVSDVTANLTIHRVKLSTAAIGTYDLKIERKGYDTYDLLIEQTPADEYRSNFPTLYGEKIETVPIYTRNKNLTLTMSTSYDAPLTLQSMTWEGDWNRPYYKSV